MSEKSKTFVFMLIVLLFGGIYSIANSLNRDENGAYIRPNSIVNEYVDANGNIYILGEVTLR